MSYILALLAGKKTYLLGAAYIISKAYEAITGDMTAGQFADQTILPAMGMTGRAAISKLQKKV